MDRCFCGAGQADERHGRSEFRPRAAGWAGKLPQGVERIDAPTPYVWIIGRTQTNGVKDYEAVHKMQDGYRITPLADWGKTPRKIEQKIDPSVDTKTEPLRQVNEMSALEYFKYGAELMKQNPPHATDWSIVARMKRIGLEPGKSFDASKVSADALSTGCRRRTETHAGQDADDRPRHQRLADEHRYDGRLRQLLSQARHRRAGWPRGQSGRRRDLSAQRSDADGKPVMAENKYVLHFNKDELPPVGAFWSLTMYDAEGFQVANPLNRFAIGDRDALKFNADGSLDLYIQNQSPGPDKESNWLPAPKSGKLGLTLRLYAPKPQVADGRWNPPAIKQTTSVGRALQ